MSMRNPFLTRYSEDPTSDAQFLRTYSPTVLDALPQGDRLWRDLTVIRSSPGGGKTSLLRLLTPGVLRALCAYQTQDAYKDLFAKLTGMGAVDQGRPVAMGAMISCAHAYRHLDDLGLANGLAVRITIALLNARITLAILRSALAFAGAVYPDDLGRLEVIDAHAEPITGGHADRLTGEDLYKWAVASERAICRTIDELALRPDSPVIGHDTLFAIPLFEPDKLLFNGEQLAERIVVLIDDFQGLTGGQRTAIRDMLVSLRSKTAVWLAERLELLDLVDVFAVGAKPERDWSVVYLESHWQVDRRRFRAFARSVADRRAGQGSDDEIVSFAACLCPNTDDDEVSEVLGQAWTELQKRLAARTQGNKNLEEWLVERRPSPPCTSGAVRFLRAMEIRLDRLLQKKQGVLSFVQPDDEQTGIREAAELFLHTEFHLPYYYGFERLCTVASCNIEQFLRLAAQLFEYVLSDRLLGKGGTLSATVQERLIDEAARTVWRNMLQCTPHPIEASHLLGSMSEFCRKETVRPSAPYAPGVTGIGLRDCEYGDIACDIGRGGGAYRHLAAVLSECIGQNLLIRTRIRSKSEEWVVLYLNRAACVRYSLPLSYGGWRPVAAKDLVQWLRPGKASLFPGEPQHA